MDNYTKRHRNPLFQDSDSDDQDDTSTSNDHEVVVSQIVIIWRSLEPPGRFLAKQTDEALWHDIGDEEAKRQTAQMLRLRMAIRLQQRHKQRPKHKQDGTACTESTSSFSSSSLTQQSSSTTTKHNSLNLNLYHCRDPPPSRQEDCFGGFFRSLLMSLLTGKDKDNIMNQYHL